MSNTLFFKIGADKTVQSYVIEDPLSTWHLEDYVPRCDACQRVVHLEWDSPPSGAVAMCGCNRNNSKDWRRVQEIK
jgi:hypothetical protein